jgi:hypothetical protein
MEFDLSLMQFDVTNSTFTAIKNASMVQVELKFQRKIMYHLANTFLPTISLLVLVEITLFFDRSKLDMAVTLSLTIMLVIYTLYQSISQTIPKTAYLKLIDYWLIFCLLAPFVIFIIESGWYLDQAKKSKAIIHPLKGWMNNVQLHKQNLDSGRKPIQLIVLGSTAIFTFTYFSFAIYYYYFP